MIITLRNFDIPTATAQQRRHGANGRTWRSPGMTLAIATWKAALEPHTPAKPLEGPVKLCLSLHYHGRGKEPRYKVTRPDLDNTAKVVIDVMTSLGFWHDDNQIAVLELCKYVVPWASNVVIEVLPLDFTPA